MVDIGGKRFKFRNRIPALPGRLSNDVRVDQPDEGQGRVGQLSGIPLPRLHISLRLGTSPEGQ